jgi:membrane protease YdiL (CAAX protease family)
MVDRGPDEIGHRPMTLLAAALWTTALSLLGRVCVQVTQAVRPGALSDVVNLGACVVLATSIMIFAVVRVHAREESLRATLGVTWPSVIHVILSIAVGAGLYPLLSTVQDLAMKRWPIATEDVELAEKVIAVPTMSARLAFVVSAFVVIPIARELFFRGLLYGAVRRATNARIAALATAFFFAALTPDWRTLPCAVALGLALARLRERTGSVVAPIAAHLAYRAVVAIPLLRGADPTEDVTYPTKWVVGGAVIAVLALAAVGTGGRRDD